jgi:hypothetical protein
MRYAYALCFSLHRRWQNNKRIMFLYTHQSMYCTVGGAGQCSVVPFQTIIFNIKDGDR